MIPSGRVARAGRIGSAYSLVSPDELAYLLDLHLFTGRAIVTAGGRETSGTGLVSFPIQAGLIPRSGWSHSQARLVSFPNQAGLIPRPYSPVLIHLLYVDWVSATCIVPTIGACLIAYLIPRAASCCFNPLFPLFGCCNNPLFPLLCHYVNPLFPLLSCCINPYPSFPAGVLGSVPQSIIDIEDEFIQQSLSTSSDLVWEWNKKLISFPYCPR